MGLFARQHFWGFLRKRIYGHFDVNELLNPYQRLRGHLFFVFLMINIYVYYRATGFLEKVVFHQRELYFYIKFNHKLFN